MILIGFMHYREKPLSLNKAYAYAAVAKAEGAELLYFSPGEVDFKNKKINGYIYENGEWRNTLSRFPDVICNVTGFSGEKQEEIAERLQNRIPFTSYSIGNKETVYENIMKYKEFSNYLVPTEKVISTEHFFKLLDKYNEVIFKPSQGHKGIDVYYIKKEGNSYKMLSGEDTINYDFNEVSNFISNKIDEEKYIVQPYINCRTKLGQPYDFRLHVQKNLKGEWVLTKIYVRISASDSIISNISRGNYVMEIIPFLKREFEEDYYDIHKYIEIFSLQFATHMDKIQKEQYNEELDELGIDIGLDSDRKICIYEVNWRPGFPPSMSMDLSVVKNAIHYAIFLAEKCEVI